MIDADKADYVNCFEALVPRMRRNGLMAIDNLKWDNCMLDAQNQPTETIGIREFNDRVTVDGHVESVKVYVGDGLALARKL